MVGPKVSEAMYNGMIYYVAKVWVGRLQRRCCCWGSLSIFLFRSFIGQKATDFFLRVFGIGRLLLMSRSWLIVGDL